MEYDRILGDAWRLTWRYKFLWIFALLGGGTAASCGGGPTFSPGAFDSSGDAGPDGVPPEELRLLLEDFPAFIEPYVGLIVAIIGLLVLVGLVFFVLSFIARGALISSTARLSQGALADFSSGWQTGLGLGWRYFGIWLLTGLVALGFLLALGVVALVLIAVAQLGDGARMLAIVVGVLFGLAAFFGMIAFFIGLTIVNQLGERAAAIDGLSAGAALRRGYDLLKARFWSGALIWLLSVAIAIAAGLALSVPAIIVSIPVGAAVVGVYMATGLSAATVATGVAGVVVWILVMWPLSSVAAAYGSVYWTLSYLMLTGRYPPPPAAADSAPTT